MCQELWSDWSIYIKLSWTGKNESLYDMDPNGMFLDVNVSLRKPQKNQLK